MGETIAVGGPWITVNEHRLSVGLEEIEGGEVLRKEPTKAEKKDDDPEDKDDGKHTDDK